MGNEIIIPKTLQRIVDTSDLEQGGVFTWRWDQSFIGVAGNNQSMSPFAIFTVPYPCRLKNVKLFILRQSNAGVIYDQNKLQLNLSINGQGTVINQPIPVAGSLANLVSSSFVLFGDPNRGGFNYNVEIDFKPGTQYQFDTFVEETIALNDLMSFSLIVTIQKK